MEAPLDTKEEFLLIRRAQSFVHAGRGVVLFFRSTPHAWVHSFVALTTIGFGIFFHITSTEWTLVLLAIGLVFVAEAINTAIEIDINLTSPEFHPYARDTKDVAAGAVLLACFTAICVGVSVFAPYVKLLF